MKSLAWSGEKVNSPYDTLMSKSFLVVMSLLDSGMMLGSHPRWKRLSASASALVSYRLVTVSPHPQKSSDAITRNSMRVTVIFFSKQLFYDWSFLMMWKMAL